MSGMAYIDVVFGSSEGLEPLVRKSRGG